MFDFHVAPVSVTRLHSPITDFTIVSWSVMVSFDVGAQVRRCGVNNTVITTIASPHPFVYFDHESCYSFWQV